MANNSIDKSHPVWEVYNLQKNCRLNVKYWTAKVTPLKKFNFWMEYLLLATAPSSAVAGLVYWQTTGGKFVWMVLTTVTALLGIAKPLLGLTKKIEDLQKLVLGYRSIESMVQELSNDIKSQDAYSPALRHNFKGFERQYDKVKAEEPVELVNKKLQEAFYAEVMEELPDAAQYIPLKK